MLTEIGKKGEGMAGKIYCPVCCYPMKPELGDKNNEGDKKLLLYREPNNTPSVCCSACFDKIQAAHNRLINNMRWEGKQKKELRKRQEEERQNAVKIERVFAVAQSVVT